MTSTRRFHAASLCNCLGTISNKPKERSACSNVPLYVASISSRDQTMKNMVLDGEREATARERVGFVREGGERARSGVPN